jgi:outer membrane protein TolC
LPRLSVTAGPDWAGTSLSSLIPNFSVGVALGYPVDGMSPLLTAGQVREAEGNRRASLAQERATREGIRQETIDARALLEAGRQEVVSARALLAGRHRPARSGGRPLRQRGGGHHRAGERHAHLR